MNPLYLSGNQIQIRRSIMEDRDYEEEPYLRRSPVASIRSCRTRSNPTIILSPESLHEPLTRDHFIPTILTFDDW